MIKEKEKESVKDLIMEVVKMFFLALIIIVPVRTFLFQPFIVRGASMEPNFQERQYLIINEFGYKNTPISVFGKDIFTVKPRKEFERGDIIVFRAPTEKKEFYIKRVIGLPGETVEINNGDVKIFNAEHREGFILDESSYLAKNYKTNGMRKVTLKDDEYYVLGDNRSASSDSRVFGPIQKSSVTGKVWLRAWPFNRIDVF